MPTSSLQRRVRRLERETFGSFCPCGYTNQWAGVWAEILTAIEQRGDGTPVGPSHCVKARRRQSGRWNLTPSLVSE